MAMASLRLMRLWAICLTRLPRKALTPSAVVKLPASARSSLARAICWRRCCLARLAGVVKAEGGVGIEGQHLAAVASGIDMLAGSGELERLGGGG
jgi:hypothetical protein